MKNQCDSYLSNKIQTSIGSFYDRAKISLPRWHIEGAEDA